jgi:hypothetical protein
MRALAYAAVAAFFFATPALAEAITFRCDDIGGASAKDWGALLLTVDEARRFMRVEFPDRNHKGETFDYRDGAFAPIQSGELPPGVTDTAPVWQFVRITTASVEFGFRSADGELQHFAWFDRASLALGGLRCLWRSHWDFKRS